MPDNEAILEIRAEVRDALEKIGTLRDDFDAAMAAISEAAARPDFDPTSESAQRLTSEVERLDGEITELAETAERAESRVKDTFDLRAEAADAIQRIGAIVKEFDNLTDALEAVSGFNVSPDSVEDLQLQLKRLSGEFVELANSGVSSLELLQAEGVDTTAEIGKIEDAANKVGTALLAVAPDAEKLRLEGIREAASDVEALQQRMEGLSPTIEDVGDKTTRTSRHISTLLSPALGRLTGNTALGRVAAAELEEAIEGLGNTAQGTAGPLGGLAVRVGGLITIFATLLVKFDEIQDFVGERLRIAFGVTEEAIERFGLQTELANRGVDTFGLSTEQLAAKLKELRDAEEEVRQSAKELADELTGRDLTPQADALVLAFKQVRDEGIPVERIVDDIGEEVDELVDKFRAVGIAVPEDLAKIKQALDDAKDSTDELAEEIDRIARRAEQGLPEELEDDVANIITGFREGGDELKEFTGAFVEAVQFLIESGEATGAIAKKIGEDTRDLLAQWEEFGEKAPVALLALAETFPEVDEGLERHKALMEEYNRVVEEQADLVTELTNKLREEEDVRDDSSKSLEELIARQEELEGQGFLSIGDVQELDTIRDKIFEVEDALNDQNEAVGEAQVALEDAEIAYEGASEAAEHFGETGDDVAGLGDDLRGIGPAARDAGKGLSEAAGGAGDAAEQLRIGRDAAREFIDEINDLQKVEIALAEINVQLTTMGRLARSAVLHFKELKQCAESYKDIRL